MYEVHIFTATAEANSDNEHGYPAGERHAIMIFSRQPSSTNHDSKLAERTAEKRGWKGVKLGRAGTVSDPERLNDKDEIFLECFKEAMMNGSALIAYSDPTEGDI